MRFLSDNRIMGYPIADRGLPTIIISLILFKALGILLTYFFFQIANEDMLRFHDFQDYKVDQLSLPFPNFGFVLLIKALSIENITDIQSIATAITLSYVRDLIIAYVLYRKFDLSTSLIFCLFVGFHPYLAIYSIKFTTGIFTSLAILMIFTQIKFPKFRLLYFVPLSIIVISCRNFTSLIFAFFYLSNIPKVTILRHKLVLIICIFCTLAFGLLISGDYYTAQVSAFSEVTPFKVELGTDKEGDYTFAIEYIYFFIQVLSRAILLFGGREKYFGEGFDSILEDHILIVIFIPFFFVIHLFSFNLFLRYCYRWFGMQGVSVTFPLIFTIFTIASLRYLAPYIPFMMACLAIFAKGYISGMKKKELKK